jgi:hypothetical protein
MKFIISINHVIPYYGTIYVHEQVVINDITHHFCVHLHGDIYLSVSIFESALIG